MILNLFEEQYGRKNANDSFLTGTQGSIAKPSEYRPDEDTQKMIAMIIDSFRWADVVMRKPRREYNDMSTLTRMMYDQMAFNIYQPNNGQGFLGDPADNWKSQAMRPIVRNQVMSIAAHVTAHLLFPKIFAYNENSESQEKAAVIMRDLVEWASDQAEYDKHTLFAIIAALVNPISITHVEYAEAYRTIKTEKVNGKWQTKEILDEENSGFMLTPVPCDELYVADFYTEDIQRQEYLIWRRVQNYATMKAKYGHNKNFQYVKAGIQIIYNDANIGFYEVYDSNLKSELCEEIIFYSKPLDLQIVIVNGVMMTDCDEPNPRLDKQYPFIAFGYENFDEGKAFYKKSLAFKMQPDADIVNTLYPMIIDGTYLNIFNPILVAGEEEVGADVMIPGGITTLINPESSVTPIRVAQDIRQGLDTLTRVEDSISKSSSVQQAGAQKMTTYQLSVREQEQATMLGPFITMLSSYVRQYGKLLISDIIQHVTVPEVNKIVDNGELIYKTIIVHDRDVDSGKKSRKIKFDIGLPDEAIEDDQHLKKSYDILKEQGGEDIREVIAKVNPSLFRDLKYKCTCSPDVISPMSDDLERTFGLEVFDKSIQAAQIGVPVDMEQAYKDFVLANYPKTKQDVNKYIKKQELGAPQQPGQPGAMPGSMPQGQPAQPGQLQATTSGQTGNPQSPNAIIRAGLPTQNAPIRSPIIKR